MDTSYFLISGYMYLSNHLEYKHVYKFGDLLVVHLDHNPLLGQSNGYFLCGST